MSTIDFVLENYPTKRKALSSRILDIVESGAKDLTKVVVERVRSGKGKRGRDFTPGYSKNYATYRESRGKQTAYVDFTLEKDTPSMLDDVGVIKKKVKGSELVITIGALNTSTGDSTTEEKLGYASKRKNASGNILGAQQKEISAVKKKIQKEIAEEIKNLFR